MQDDQDTKAVAGKASKAAKPSSKKAAAGGEDAKAVRAAEQQQQAQLEMLMLDDHALQDMAKIGGQLL